MKLAVNKLTTQQWSILNYLKMNAVGKENCINGVVLATKFGIRVESLRIEISKIRKNQNVIVGSLRDRGYFIPLQEEKEKSLRYAENKVLSELETRLNQNPTFAIKAFKKIQETLKKVDGAPQGQITVKFNGWEKDINYFGDKYQDEKDSKNK